MQQCHPQVENFGALRYERGMAEAMRGRALIQRHEATDADLANFRGDSPLVRRSVREQDYNVADQQGAQFL